MEADQMKCIIIVLLSLGLLITVTIVIILAVQRHECLSAALGSVTGPACPDGWAGYQRKCYYFSGVEGDWALSQNRCSALSASLAGINTQQDMNFIVRLKGEFDHWIGLQRDPGQPWKWTNGTEFDNWFPIGEREGDCAYLNNQGRVSTSQCTSSKRWICTKPDVFTKAK